MKTNLNYKVLFLVPVFGAALNSCKTFYSNTFVMTNDKKVLLKDEGTNEERLVDCSKGNQDTKQLLSDLPYFKEGDPVKVQTEKRYEGFRVFNIDETTLDYNHDTIQIRKDKEKIEAFKLKAVQSQNQQ